MRLNSYGLWLRLIPTLYAVLYVAAIGFQLLLLIGLVSESGYETPPLAESLTAALCAVLFIAGAVYAWYHEFISGLIFLAWHFLCWTFALLLWPEAGILLILIFPMLLVAVFLMLKWQVANNTKFRSHRRRWRYILRVLMVNYAAIYLLNIVANLGPMLGGWELPTRVDELASWDVISPVGMTVIFAAVVFFTAFALSWTHEILAGSLLAAWYVLIFYATSAYPEFAYSGPWTLFGVAILVQGALYIIYHFRFVKRH